MGANRDSLAADSVHGSNRDSVARDGLPGTASLDSTLPPTPLRDLLAADGATVFVLSADPELIGTVEQAGGDQYPVEVVADWPALVNAVAQRRTHIVLLDSDASPLSMVDAVAELHHVASTLVVLVAAGRDEAQSLMGLLSKGKIHRLLVKPADGGITRLLLESAIARYLQLRDQRGQRDQIGQPDQLDQRGPYDDPYDQYDESAVLVDDVRPVRRYRRSRTSWSAWLLATGLVTAAVATVIVWELQGVGWRESIERSIEWGRAIVTGTERPAVVTRIERPAIEPLNELDQATSAGRPVGAAPEAIERMPAPSAETGSSGNIVGTPSAAAIARHAEISDVRTVEADLGASAPRDELEPPVDARVDAPPASTESASGPTPASRPQDERSAAWSDASERAESEPVPLDSARARVGSGSFPPQPASNARSTGELDALLDLIDTRLADGRLLTPYDDSVLIHFEKALALGSNDPRLLARRTQIAASLVDAAHSALESGDMAEAQRLAREAFRVGAERSALARLDRDLESARRAQTFERHTSQLSMARAQLRQGRLLDANGEEGALSRLAALRRAGSTVPGLADAWRDLSAAVEQNVRAAISAQDFASAKRWAAALVIDGGDSRLGSELEFEARQAEFLATPVPAGELELIEGPAPVYPNDARATGNEGWVDLEFVVDREGRPRDIVVVDSRPGRRFVDAALEAVAGHRYAPFELDGRVYERRASVRVRFALR